MLAVLPFENLSGDSEQDYFSDGLTEEMISRLGNLQPERLGVIARTSSIRYKGTKKPLAEIAQELGVDYVIEGSVRRAADDVRITAQLIQVSDQTHLWADNYEKPIADVFAVQSEVADKVAASLALKLIPEMERTYKVNPEAHEAYLKGLYFRALQTREDIEKALSHFQHAVEKDPLDARAWAGLSDAYLMMDLRQAPPAFRAQSLSAAEKALQLDSKLAEGHVALGLIQEIYDWNWTAAEQSFERAVKLNSNSSYAHSEYGVLLQRIGRAEAALPELTRSVDLNPVHWAAYYRLALAYIAIGDHKLAIQQLQKASELTVESNFWIASSLGWEYLQGGAYDKARKLSKKSDPYLEILADAAQGNTQLAMTNILRLARATYDPGVRSYGLAAAFAYLRKDDMAISQLESVYALNPMYLIDIKVDPYLKRLHSHPRFQALLDKMKFPK